DRLNAQGDAMARLALGAILLGRWTVDQIYQASVKQLENQKKKKHHSWWQRFNDAVHSVTKTKWFQWTAAVAGVVGLLACGAACVIIGGVALTMSAVSTAESCGHGEGKDCAIGLTSLALGGVGKGAGKMGEKMVEDGRVMTRTWYPIQKLGGY